MIKLESVTKIYDPEGRGTTALDSIGLEIKKGDLTMVIGRSGSGKSTLLGVMGGLIRPDEGRVILNGKDIYEMSDAEISRFRGDSIGFVFQFSGLLSTLNVMENVILPSRFSRKQLDARTRAKEILNNLGIGDKLASFPSELSGGEMKRAAIARALINDPDIILADEPTSDLDVSTEEEIMELFKRINREGRTIVMVTHNPDLAAYATNLYRMDRGKIEPVPIGDRPSTGKIK